MKNIVLYRNNYLGPEILGHLMVLESNEEGGSKMIFECKTIELGWKNNERNVSCIPTGYYNIVREYSPRFDEMLWELKGVPNRSEAKIHVANFYAQIEGCIALGDLHIRINSDPFPDVRNSRNTVDRFHRAMEGQEQSTIHIIGRS